jgi:hypothetical protein
VPCHCSPARPFVKVVCYSARSGSILQIYSSADARCALGEAAKSPAELLQCRDNCSLKRDHRLFAGDQAAHMFARLPVGPAIRWMEGASQPRMRRSAAGG